MPHLRPLIRSNSARQVLLGVTALVFTGIAIATLIAPDAMARGVGESRGGIALLVVRPSSFRGATRADD